jgi:hypothetical protein
MLRNIPFQYSDSEYADIRAFYGFCNDNVKDALLEYRRRFLSRRLPNEKKEVQRSSQTCARYLKIFYPSNGRTPSKRGMLTV